MVTGQRISLHPFDRPHLERTRAWVNDPQLSRLLGRAWPVSDEEHEDWFRALQRNKNSVHFAIETNTDRRHIGNVWLCEIDWRHRHGELRVVIGDVDGAGRGFGTEAISLLCAYGFERLNLHKIRAYVLGINPRALRAFEKAGFAVEGVLKEDRWDGDRYCDVYLLGRLR
jgi:RimJ/RimL family protein N-acetyltransferase